MSLFYRVVFTGSIVAVLGLLVGFSPWGRAFDERYGLDILFSLRGPRKPPADVIVVSIDKTSSDRMGVSRDFRKWPRSLHARLVRLLSDRGASAIVFDIMFEEKRGSDEDGIFARAMTETGKVVLCCYLKTEILSVGDHTVSGNHARLFSLSRPAPLLRESTAAIAPFPLPKVPQKLSQFWTFKPEAGDIPTLPVAALHVFSGDVMADFWALLRRAGLSPDGPFPGEGKDRAHKCESFICAVREVVQGDPGVLERLEEELKISRKEMPERDYRKIAALVGSYRPPETRYFNFYGPPQTIPTIPYHRVLSLADPGEVSDQLADLDGKAVFVGHSTLFQDEQKEGFFTVFSRPTGLDISGVELAATGFANLLDGSSIEPLPHWESALVFLAWGMVLACVCLLLPAGLSAPAVLGCGLCYLFAAEFAFARNFTWSPVMVPLFVQAPFGFVGAVIIRYRHAEGERKNIRKAIRYYLPAQLVDQLAKNIASITSSHERVYAICLSTDAEKFTTFSEELDPSALADYMNKYFETIFTPVRQHGGVVSNVVGDSMLAVWVAPGPNPSLHARACLAALDIGDALDTLRKSSPLLYTRVGIHSGYIVLGIVGAIDHYEFRPIGDIVNTATRVEGLNKYLQTTILASEEAIGGVQGIVTREAGRFITLGKSQPLRLFELMGRSDADSAVQQQARAIYQAALERFRARSWEKAAELFLRCKSLRGSDGVCDFYVDLCNRYMQEPPPEEWDGSIRMERK